MKTLARFLFVLSGALIIPNAGYAQFSGPVPAAGTSAKYMSEFKKNPTVEREHTWWWGLEKEVNIPAGTHYTDVTAADLQRIIYFAQQPGIRVDFRASLPQILSLYENHTDPRLRIMAASALGVIGEPYALSELGKAVRHEKSPFVRRVTGYVLKSFESPDSAAR